MAVRRRKCFSKSVQLQRQFGHRVLGLEKLEDRRVLATFTVANTLDSGDDSLRWAIEQANANENPDEIDDIRFASNVDNQTINLSSALPEISEPVSIEVNPFFTTTPDTVTLNWTGTSSGSTSGLRFNVTTNDLGFSTIQTINGLKITNFTGHGIEVVDLSDDSNFFIDENEIDDNGGDGIHIDLPTGQNIDKWDIRNNIITNNAVGIRVNNSTTTEFNIFANKIGTDGTSTSDGNSSHGIYLSDVSTADNASGISLNTISGNGEHGIFLEDTVFSQGDIASNEVGVDETSSSKIPNDGDGIHLLRSRTTIGGSNDIAGNDGDGIEINDSDLVSVSNNRIGTAGVLLNPGLGNLGAGVNITNGSQQTTVSTNFIYYNGLDGVAISGSTTDRNELTSNDFRANSGTPIDLLGNDGHTFNDFNDDDPGPNDLMNYPLINAGTITLSGSDWTVPYSYDADIAGDYRFEFYVYDPGDDRYDHVASKDVLGIPAIPGSFFGNVTLTDGTEVSAGDRLSVLAVRTSGSTNIGNTSELSLPTGPLQSDTNPPTITDVRIDRRASGSAWAPAAEVSFASRIAAGEQLRSISTQGADTVEIVFSEGMMLAADGSDFTLRGLNGLPISYSSFNHTPGSNIATWTFSQGLPDDKLAIHLDTNITDLSGNVLDGDWANPDFNTPDNFIDDILDPEYNPTFETGDGIDGSMGGEFRFHFAILTGDSDGDGRVEGLSGVWNGDDVQPGTLGDIDGDGIAGTVADEAIVTSLHANVLPLRAVSDADFNDDEIINVFDLARWEANYGQGLATHADGDANRDGKVDAIDLAMWEDQYAVPFAQLPVGLDADFDGDGQVTGLDLLIWQTNQGLGYGDADYDGLATGLDFQIWQTKYNGTNPLKSAWYENWNTAVAALTAGSAPGSAPVITDVVISGSASTHPDFSFTTVDGDGGQLATVPVGGADTISIVFSEDVNVAADSIRVVGLTKANVPEMVEFTYDSITFTATWRFEGWAIYGDNYLISITDAVSDTQGNLLDGEWTNPASITTTNTLVSEFPSGDGSPGGSFDFAITLLPGDADLDGDVDTGDLGILSANYNQGLNKLFTDGDVDGDGDVDSGDLGQLVGNYGMNLQDVIILADLNSDFDVDDNDLQTISDNLGMTSATYADGDLNGDGVVDQLDLDLAFAQFGIEIDLVA